MGSVSGTHVTGRLLVATPQIGEGVFRRSVVLVLHHDDDGAQGVVLNRPIDADVDAVLPGWEEHASRPAKVFQGGPVQLDSALGLVAVAGDAAEPAGVKRLFGSVALVDLDSPPVLVADEVAALRIFAGYAGWSAGQLEGEIRTGSWYVVNTEGSEAFTDEPGDLWRQVLRRQPEPLRWVAWYPADVSLN
jgi:putative transcriptional regulator